MERTGVASGTWTVLAGRVPQDVGPTMRMVVRLHLVSPRRAVLPVDALALAPLASGLERSDAWWGALALTAAHQVEEAIREGRLNILPVVDGKIVVRLDYLPEATTGPELPDDGEPARLVHSFTV